VAIDAFPAALQPIIQTNFLERKFEQALRAKLAYRQIADREPFPARIGETLTKTRAGLLPAVTTPMSPVNNGNFDSGFPMNQTGQSANNAQTGFPVEQYTLTINQHGNSIDLNVVTDRVGIANQFVQNAITLGEQAARSLDTLAANALFNTYMGGNTRVTTTLATAGTAVHVDDVRGFQTVFSSTGLIVPVSSSNTLSVMVGADLYTLVGVALDSPSTSTAPGGLSGTLTFSASVSISDGTAGNAVVAANAPMVLRSSGFTSAANGNIPNPATQMAATTLALAGLSNGTMQMVNNCMQAANILRSNGVPDVNGKYCCYIDPLQLQGLFNDGAFQLLYRGAYQSRDYHQGDVLDIGGLLFIPTNLAPQQTLSGVKIHRAIVCGKGALVEGDFAGQDAEDTATPLAEISDVDGVRMVTRAPMDRLQQLVAQSWLWIGGFVTPSDMTTNPNTIPTATNSAYKRAVIIESL
jgi:hypothetical protein